MDKFEVEAIVNERVGKIFVRLAEEMADRWGTKEAILRVLEDQRYFDCKERNDVEYSSFDPVVNWDTDKSFTFRKNGSKADAQDLTQVNPHILGGMVRTLSEDQLVIDPNLIQTEDTSTPREYSQTALRVQELAGLFETEEESYGWGVKSTLV